MSETIRPLRPKRVLRAHRGQALIIALAVLFLLLFIGGIFVAQIARNLSNAGRSRDTQDSQAFAEAGINYVNNQLTYSEEGADWRPVPTPPNQITSGSNPGDPNGYTDPDYQWLSQGFQRIYFHGGRALVRVTYDPKPDDPRSQYLRIESVGRSGELAQGNDPTVFVQAGNSPRLRREMVAFKQIGLTDYLFYITNHDRRAGEAFIGNAQLENSPVAAGQAGFRDVAMVLGDPTLAGHPTGINGSEIIFGAPIRSNPSLTFGGDVYLFESPRGTSPNISPENVLVSGSINLAPVRDVNLDKLLDIKDHQVYINTAVSNSNNGNVLASIDPNFNTYFGIIRDGAPIPDAVGFSRGIPRLEPPVMDSFVASTGHLRYRDLTRFSGRWVGASYNTGFNGWGNGLYIDNGEDLQKESGPGVPGSYSLRADWINPKAGFPQSAWNGPFYRPPGVQIELLGDHIRLTRNDSQVFRKPDGTPISGSGGKVLDIPLSDGARANFTFPDGTVYPLPPLAHDGDDPANHSAAAGVFPTDKKSYGVNLVIMAEGNVRVKGVYGTITDSTSGAGDHLSRVHVTIVTGGTAYVEGNLLKGDGYYDGAKTTMDRASTCAVLAKDYVCVNTTMFMAPQNQTNVWARFSPDLDLFLTQIGSARPTYDTGVGFGVDPSTYQIGVNASPLFLMVRHASDNSASSNGSAMNLQVNPGLDGVGGPSGNSFYRFNEVGLPPETYALGLKFSGGAFVNEPEQVAPTFEQRAFALRGTNGANFDPNYYTPSGAPSAFFPTLTGVNTNAGGFDNLFRIQKDTAAAGVAGFSEADDYLLSAAIVAPLDIRIEAALYAQEKSFFVIPGYSFNADPNDTRLNFVKTNARPSYSPLDSAQDRIAKDVFPYYGEPMDVRITLFGAISENYTALPGDQAAWQSKWGYFPDSHGSSGISVPNEHLRVHDLPIFNPAADPSNDFRTSLEKGQHITRGLRYVYDPSLAMPYQHPTGTDISDVLSPLNSVQNRKDRALRFKVTLATAALPEIRQTLPPIPRLPVCPGLLYFGDSDRPFVP